MADNVAITPGTGATIATDERKPLPTIEDELEEIALALLMLL